MFPLSKRVFLWWWGLLLCVACVPETVGVVEPTGAVVVPPSMTIVLTPTAVPTHTPTPTNTAVPPIVYETGPVLAQLITGDCVDACVGHVAGAPPIITIYADGRLVTFDYIRLQQGQLDNPAVCDLLAAMPETGFYDFDVAAYEEKNRAYPRLAAVMNITLNSGERRRTLSLHGVTDYMEGKPLAGEIDVTAVDNALNLISSYIPLATDPYQPERIAVLIQQTDDDYYTGGVHVEAHGEWPLPDLSLGDLYRRPELKRDYGGVEVVLSGAEATAVYDLYAQPQDQFNARLYTENGVSYGVSIVPLFPFQASAGMVGRTIEIPAASLDQNFQIICQVASE